MITRIVLIVAACTGIAALIFLSTSCRTIPSGVTAVTPFDVNKYLGKWYEIARFDFRFERNLNNTTANYSLNANNTVRVVNRGYNYVENKWSQATGKAKFVKEPNKAMLKVSFFGPFYGGYNVVELDKDYKYALIIGQSTKYMWLLSREKTMPKEIIDKYLETAKNAGCDVSKLIWVEQNDQQ